MSDNDLSRATDRALDGRDDPNRGPLDRAANAVTGGSGGVGGAMNHDDPNRGPLDRAANAMTGHDDPNRGPLDRAANAMTGHDDPNRGPLDRAANAMTGHDDPNRGPLDRAANAITGGTGGVSAAMHNDDPNRGPLDRTANAMAGGAAATSTYGATGGRVISAAFDSQDEAERAVAELRQAGVDTGSLSIIARNRGTTTARDGEGEITDEHHSNLLRGILGGGALGAGLGVAALAIPGVGPLVAAGAIAASVVPEAMAVGAAVGAAAGTFNEVLLKHGIDEEDVSYYGDQMKKGGVLVTVNPGAGVDASRARDILTRCGGHTASQPRASTM